MRHPKLTDSILEQFKRVKTDRPGLTPVIGFVEAYPLDHGFEVLYALDHDGNMYTTGAVKRSSSFRPRDYRPCQHIPKNVHFCGFYHIRKPEKVGAKGQLKVIAKPWKELYTSAYKLNLNLRIKLTNMENDDPMYQETEAATKALSQLMLKVYPILYTKEKT